jgi:hypothetical protein
VQAGARPPIVIEPYDGNQGPALTLVGKGGKCWPAKDFSCPADERLGEGRRIIGVGHDHHPQAFAGDEDRGLIADIPTALHDDERSVAVGDGCAEPVRTDSLSRQHLARGLRRKEERALASLGPTDEKQEIGDVCRRRPQPRGRMFGEDIKTSGDLGAVAKMASHRLRLFRKRLGEGRMGYLERVSGRPLPRRMAHQRFGDLVAAARIVIGAPPARPSP